MVHYITDSPYSQYPNRPFLITKILSASRQGGTTLRQVMGTGPAMALREVSREWLNQQANMEHRVLMQMTSSDGQHLLEVL